MAYSMTVQGALNPVSDNAVTIGTASLRFNTINAVSHTVYAASGDANAGAVLQSGVLYLGAGGATTLDTRVMRTGTKTLTATDAAGGNATFAVVGGFSSSNSTDGAIQLQSVGVKTTLQFNHNNDTITYQYLRTGGAVGLFGQVIFDAPPVSGSGFTGFAFTGSGMVVGVPTGGQKGAGTINLGIDIYKNNTAYTNPDYVLELWDTGKIEKFKGNPGAENYELKSLDQAEKVMRSTHRLPGMTDEPMGMFDRGDWVLEKMEEAFVHLVELNHRIKKLEQKLGVGG